MDDLIKVYRVENVTNVGMYCAIMSREMFESKAHPSPHDDAKLGPIWNNISKLCRERFNFGFASLEQLKSWIYMTEWRESLDKEGFKVSVYIVDPRTTHIGDTQCVFIMETSKLDHTLSLLEV